MPLIRDTFEELGDRLDRRPNAREHYEAQVASKTRLLDVGGRNQQSRSARRLKQLGTNPNTTIVCTDILPDYGPDLVDDITATTIPPGSYDGIYCDAILEHVIDYQAAIKNMHAILVDDGEAFIYVPFMYMFHDMMDHHRFTITEIARMLDRFSEVKIFLPGRASGYGYVLLHVLTYSKIERFPRVERLLTNAINSMLGAAVAVAYRRKPRNYSVEDAQFFYQHVNFNHGFCAWVKK